MMHQCCENMVGPCTCGVFHGQSSSLSVLFNTNSCSDHHQYASVDCTLSLGTPSTRIQDRVHQLPSYFCWDVVNSPSAPQSHKNTSRSDELLQSRRCANCDTTSTPLWRNGPRGPKSLCNACGIRFKKEERRASAAAATGGGTEHMFNNNPSWVQKSPCYSPAGTEFRLIDDVDTRDSFLSWRLNVTDRPGLVVHDFTR